MTQYDIEMHEVSDEFARCWDAAGLHIQRQAQGPIPWLKSNLNPPFLEHISFRLGNQIFFVRLEDVEGRIEVPGNRGGLVTIAEGWKGYACLMPMQRKNGQWNATGVGWGLLDMKTRRWLDPVSLISDKRIEMTDWELQDFGVQVVRDHLVKMGRKLMSWQGNPSVDPSIWFVGDHGPEWVVVRVARYPKKSVKPPKNWNAIVKKFAHISNAGWFAPVLIENAEQKSDSMGAISPIPLWRGHELAGEFDGLVPGPQPGMQLLETLKAAG